MSLNVLLVGATGGIGQALLNKAIADAAVENIFATTRKDPGLQHEKVRWLELDYTRPDTIGAVANTVSEQVPRLDRLICATGYLHGEHGDPEKSLEALRPDHMAHAYLINAAGPLTLLANVHRSLQAANRPTVAFLSAQVGSIEDNGLGGWYSYRMSKAALNMGIKSAAIEMARWRNGACAIVVHPGTTHSKLSGPFVARRKAPVRTAEQTGERLYQLIGDVSAADNGRFLTADHQTLPW